MPNRSCSSADSLAGSDVVTRLADCDPLQVVSEAGGLVTPLITRLSWLPAAIFAGVG